MYEFINSYIMLATFTFIFASIVYPKGLVSKEKIYNPFNFFIAPIVLFFSMVTIPLALFFYIITNTLKSDKKASRNFINVLFAENIRSAYPYHNNEDILLPKDILSRFVDIIIAPFRIYFSVITITIEIMIAIPFYLIANIDLSEKILLAYVFRGDEI